MRYDQLANIFTKSHLLGQLCDLASKTKLTFDYPFWNWGKFSCESTQYSLDCGPSPVLAYKSVYSIHKLYEAKSTQPDALRWLKFYFEFRDEGGTGGWLGLEFWFLHSFLWKVLPITDYSVSVDRVFNIYHHIVMHDELTSTFMEHRIWLYG